VLAAASLSLAWADGNGNQGGNNNGQGGNNNDRGDDSAIQKSIHEMRGNAGKARNQSGISYHGGPVILGTVNVY